jgi:hypothetical protein
MYLIRRGFKVKPGTTYRAAQLISKMAKAYEGLGRSQTRVYWSGYTVPGNPDTVYMDWIEETLRSPYGADAKSPKDLSEIYDELKELQESTFIEFYEMA